MCGVFKNIFLWNKEIFLNKMQSSGIKKVNTFNYIKLFLHSENKKQRSKDKLGITYE